MSWSKAGKAALALGKAYHMLAKSDHMLDNASKCKPMLAKAGQGWHKVGKRLGATLTGLASEIPERQR